MYRKLSTNCCCKPMFYCLNIHFYNCILTPIFAQILFMEEQKKGTALYWLLFLISTAALVFAIYTHWPWLTLILPFVTTFFVKAMNIM